MRKSCVRVTLASAVTLTLIFDMLVAIVSPLFAMYTMICSFVDSNLETKSFDRSRDEKCALYGPK